MHATVLCFYVIIAMFCTVKEEVHRMHTDNSEICQQSFTPILFIFQAKYIAQCIDEIKQELRQDNLSVKATAVAKLTYVCVIVVILFLHLLYNVLI